MSDLQLLNKKRATNEEVTLSEQESAVIEPLSGGSTVHLDAVNNSVMCGTRSRTLQVIARSPNVEPPSMSPAVLIAVAREIEPPKDGDSNAKATSALIPIAAAAVQRTSARVSKRNRTQAEASAANALSASTAHTTTTTNNLITTANKKTAALTVGKKGSDLTKIQTDKLNVRTRRSWELWSIEDKDAFFEALCEYGKDFENIQSYIAQRSKKKGVQPNMIKNKDQVRHFYYRTWHKIVKYLDLDLLEDVKKHTLELYSLINYAELRKKKLGCLNVKNQQKLNELVFHGVTTVKFKGKKLRIKTPVCRALKKLNNMVDLKEPESTKLPKEITVEFRPRNNSAFLHVQNLAQNPRVRTRVTLQRRLSSLVAFLEKKWKPQRLKQKEALLASLSDDTTSSEVAPSLKVYLKAESTLCMLTVASVDNACSTDVCLENYMRGMAQKCDLKDSPIAGGKTSRSKTTLSSKPKGKGQQLQSQPVVKVALNMTPISVESKTGAFHSVSEQASKLEEQLCGSNDPQAEAERSVHLLKNMLQSFEDEPKTLSPALPETIIACETPKVTTTQVENAGNISVISNSSGVSSPSVVSILEKDCKEEITVAQSVVSCPPSIDLYLATQAENKNLTLGQFLSLSSPTQDKDFSSSTTTTSGPGLVETSSMGHVGEVENLEEKRKLLEVENQKAMEMLEKLKNGWTREECNTLTFGELYLMMDHTETIVLEYEFVPPKRESNELNVVNQTQHIQHLTQVLNKLISVASTYFTDFKTKQTPISPTCRSNSRATHSTLANKSGTGRGSTRSPGVRTVPTSRINATHTCKSQDNKAQGSTGSLLMPSLGGSPAGPGNISSSSSSSSPDGSTSSDTSKDNGDKHTFAMPLNVAPRPIKLAPNITSDNVREQLEKLATARRNHRQRNRRPLVVPRPLLPSVDRSHAPAMTVLHLVPSTNPGMSPMHAFIPNSSHSVSTSHKIPIPSSSSSSHTKKIMKVLPSAVPIPFLKPMSANSSGIVFQPGNLTQTHHVVVATSSSNSGTLQTLRPLGTTTLTSNTIPPLVSARSLTLTDVNKVRLMPDNNFITLSPSSMELLSSNPKMQQRIGNLCITTGGGSQSPPQISIPESSSSSSSSSSLLLRNPINNNSSSNNNNNNNSNFSTNMSSLLNISMSEEQAVSTTQSSSEHLLDFNSNSSLSTVFGLQSSTKSDCNSLLETSTPPMSPLIRQLNDPLVSSRHTTPPHSPNNSVGPGGLGNRFKVSSPGPDGNWLNGESCDFSLSSLLNTLESPVKSLPNPQLAVDGSTLDNMSRLGPDVETHLQCLINENSVDYVAKFADLAAQIASTSAENNKCT